ncbi:MAG TPA: 5-dehydro-4-deoxy-D-glucuronate isomerase [Tepidisphaeraceae bacterium]|jgi:4-deoxy-L-threo-5-hexosulose-uronate ketol-isomerase|nr:5-dehydro-4-deoxy-D-glucuronate isomerase [Tepidisphaeraceae bacterium]
MKTRIVADQTRYQRMTTAELRESFLVEDLFQPGSVDLIYTDADRAVIGSIVPTGKKLALATSKEQLASDYFAERREIGVLNTGAAGNVIVDGKPFAMENCDGLYVGRGTRQIEFESRSASEPARFFLISYPAHTVHPTAHAKKSSAEAVNLGSVRDANQRTIYKYIHPGGIQGCQLVMGFTQLKEGNIWNTMPPHTHLRRSEVYLYFNLDPGARVFHMMGTPQETRHLVVKDGQAVISPSWSIHAGAGTQNYSFIWAMGGENQAFDDMDPAPITALK